MTTARRWASTRDREIALESEFEEAQKAARIARIKRVAADNPDLTFTDLAERFGCSAKVIAALLPGEGAARNAAALVSREDVRRCGSRGVFSLGWRKKAAQPPAEYRQRTAAGAA